MVKLEDIITGLSSLGVEEGDLLMVHSSLKSFGYVKGGAETVIQALLEVVGEKGTIVMPTHTECSPDNYDPKTTPCRTGIIPETFRKMRGVRRNLFSGCPACALGHLSSKIITEEKNISDWPYDSPYYKVCSLGGKVLLLGVDQGVNTAIHEAIRAAFREGVKLPCYRSLEMFGPPEDKIFLPLPKEYLDKRDEKGYLPDCPDGFNRFDRVFLEKGIMKIQKIGASTSRLIDGKRMLKLIKDILEKEPFFMIKKSN